MTLREETGNRLEFLPSRVRYDISPEDVLDQSTLDGISRKQDEAEANIEKQMLDQHPFDDAVSADDFRELARRTRQGEDITSLRL